MAWYSYVFKNFPQFTVISTPKGFSVVNKEKVDFFWNSLAFLIIQQMMAIWSLISFPFVNPACIYESSWFTYYRSLTWKILSITLLACEMSTIVQQLSILWHCPSLGLQRKVTFSSPVATAEFSKFAGILSATLLQQYLLGFEIAQLEFRHFH